MTRRTYPWTEAELAQLNARGASVIAPATLRTRRINASSQRVTTVEAMEGGYQLIWLGKLPNMNVQRPDWRRRWNLKQSCLRAFGILPFPATQFADITVTRVLGPRERLMDAENFAYALKGCLDALPNRRLKTHGVGYTGGGNWIRDDSPRDCQVTYVQDKSRRKDGPRIELVITYQEDRDDDRQRRYPCV